MLAATTGLLYYYALSGRERGHLSPLRSVSRRCSCYGFYLEGRDCAVERPAVSTETCTYSCLYSWAVWFLTVNVGMGLGAVVAAALVGVLAGVLCPLAIPLYCVGLSE